tara:strand:- start:1284 stop:1388 length:105 start_codon:yes stop_codon:yes gene_type:complete
MIDINEIKVKSIEKEYSKTKYKIVFYFKSIYLLS